MFGGPEMYDLAKHLTRERARQADHNRMVKHVQQVRAEARKASVPAGSSAEGWTLEWTTNGLAGGRVTVSDPITGKTHTGRHPFDWDRALTRALHGSG